MGPHFRIDVELIGRDHIGGRAELALLSTLHVVWHRRKPNIDVESDLMASVLGEHRPTARLRHVADQKTIPTDLFCVLGKSFDEANKLRIAPVAVTRQPHDLPGRSSDRQWHSAGEAAVEITADRARRPGKRRRLTREQFLGRRQRRIRILQRRQRYGIERARRRGINQMLLLRDCRTRGSEHEDGEQASGSAHQQLSYRSVSHWWRGRRRRAPGAKECPFLAHRGLPSRAPTLSFSRATSNTTSATTVLVAALIEVGRSSAAVRSGAAPMTCSTHHRPASGRKTDKSAAETRSRPRPIPF